MLAQGFASTAGVLAGVEAQQLEGATPCASWRVRELVNHVIDAAAFAAFTAETGEAPADRPAGEDATDFCEGDYVTEFNRGAARAVKAFEADGVMDKTLKLPFGDLPGGVFVNIATMDTFTHGWDLARATGQPTDLDPELAVSLLAFAQGFLPDALRGPDGTAPFGPQVEAPAGAGPADQLAAFLGRQV
jgi:uncharacterized protein (TIGR03086 family)